MMKRRFSSAALIAFALTVPTAPTMATPPPSRAVAGVQMASYQPTAPQRVADTRTSGAKPFGFITVGAGHIHVQLIGRADVTLPADTKAVVVNVTIVDNLDPGFVTVYPAGTAVPLASNLNAAHAGDVVANLVTVAVGVDGAIDLYSNMRTNLVVDLFGAYTTVNGAESAGRFVSGASRVLDTRLTGVPLLAGATRLVDVASAGVPADARAVVVNLGAADAAPGYWSAFPAADTRPPATSNLNIEQPGALNALAIVPLSANHSGFNVYSQSGGQLVVDVVGWFTGNSALRSTDGLFVPVDPHRLLDTRTQSTGAVGSSPPIPQPGSTLPFPLPSGVGPDSISAAAVNITAVDTLDAGFVTAYPAGQQRPGTANANVNRIAGCVDGPFSACGGVVATAALVAAGEDGFDVYTQTAAHIVVDVAGWYLGTPTTPAPGHRSCNALQLQTAVTELEPPSQSRWWEIVFTNTSGTACTLNDYPTVGGVETSGAVAPLTTSHTDFHPNPHPLETVAPGSRVAFKLAQTYVCDASGGATNQQIWNTLRIGLPAGQTTDITLKFDGACGAAVSNFGIPDVGPDAD